MRSLLAFCLVLILSLDAQAGFFARLKAKRAAASSCAAQQAAAAPDCGSAAMQVATPPQTIIFQGQTYQLVPPVKK